MVKQGPGAGIVENERNFLRVQQKVDRHDDRTGFQNAEIGQWEPVGIDAIETDTVSLANAALNQRGGHPVANPVHSGEIQRAAIKHNGLLTGETPDTGPNMSGNANSATSIKAPLRNAK